MRADKSEKELVPELGSWGPMGSEDSGQIGVLQDSGVSYLLLFF